MTAGPPAAKSLRYMVTETPKLAGLLSLARPRVLLALVSVLWLTTFLGVYLEPATRLLESLTLFSDGTEILKARFEVAVVAKRFVFRVATATQGCAVLHAGHVLRCVFDMKFTLDIQRTIVDNLHCIAGRRLFIISMSFVMIGQSARGAASNHFLYIVIGYEVRLTPGIAPGDEKLAFGISAFADMYAQTAVPLDIDIFTLKGSGFFVAHEQPPSKE